MSGSSLPEPATSGIPSKNTDVGSVFVSNYPPYSAWSPEVLPEVERALESPPVEGTPLGLYLHIPFCRKRCKFCYFRVYTDKNAQDIRRYLDSLATEVERYSRLAAVQGRPLTFIYFGGGTPSYIAAKHLLSFVERIQESMPWTGAREITFECEPGTLTQSKLEAIREIGVTRLSLGVENFDDDILKENGRAHQAPEIYRCLPWIRDLDFDQLNIDLISGMVGETWDTWKETVSKTIDVWPDSVTIYQLELPFNTVYSSHLLEGGQLSVADWKQKRDWHQYAVERLAEAGYRQSSAYTLVRKDKPVDFVYRNSVWRGCDLIGAGVASFGHLSGYHLQNAAAWDDYHDAVESGGLPLTRGFKTTPGDRLTRELILLLKLGRLQTRYFQEKFAVDVTERFAPAFEKLRSQGWLSFDSENIKLTPKGLLRVDQLLPEFYESQYRGSRYT